MKRLLLVTTVAVAASVSAWADTVTLGAGGSLLGTGSFGPATGTATTSGTPYWNNNSNDGLNMNAGYFLTGSGGAANFGTNYLGSTPTYAGTSLASTANVTNFTFLRDASSFSVSLVFAKGATANVAGNDFGWYDTATNTRTSLVGPLSNDYNANVSGLLGLVTLNSTASYGFYSTICLTAGNCHTVYTNAALNSGTGFGNQHFALFADSTTASTLRTFYLGLERLSPGTGEGYGDFNDYIVKITTGVAPETVIPEPATLSFVGLGLVGLAIRRYRAKR